MRYLLDSNICIAWLKGNDAVIRQIVAVGRDQIGLCANSAPTLLDKAPPSDLMTC
jgi:predicted nucleic acid-binding protein